jgi:hypothetical protein
MSLGATAATANACLTVAPAPTAELEGAAPARSQRQLTVASPSRQRAVVPSIGEKSRKKAAVEGAEMNQSSDRTFVAACRFHRDASARVRYICNVAKDQVSSWLAKRIFAPCKALRCLAPRRRRQPPTRGLAAVKPSRLSCRKPGRPSTSACATWRETADEVRTSSRVAGGWDWPKFAQSPLVFLEASRDWHPAGSGHSPVIPHTAGGFLSR